MRRYPSPALRGIRPAEVQTFLAGHEKLLGQGKTAEAKSVEPGLERLRADDPNDDKQSP
jgi:hypothetical protein